MMIRYTKHSAAAVLLLGALFPPVSPADGYSTIVAFGDSLSDTGNKYVVTGLSNTPPYDLLDASRLPDGPYTRGGLHHSNGATWIEQFARPLDLGDAVRPALRNPGRAANYAYGGARARDGSPEPDLVACLGDNDNLHLSGQVTTFLGDVNHSAPGDALYAVFIGGNDVADAVRAFTCDPTGVTSIQIIGGALASVQNNIINLYTAGARNFVVMNVPDLGLAPAFNPPLTIPEASWVGTCLSLLYNFGTLPGSPVPPACGLPEGIPGLVDLIAGLQAQASEELPGIEITSVDIYSKFVQLVNAPLETEPQIATYNCADYPNNPCTCVEPNEPPYACKNPDNYVFWDGIHPTKATHGLIAAEVEAAIGH
jgi:phospholipase/lecithinase/hemolysin